MNKRPDIDPSITLGQPDTSLHVLRAVVIGVARAVGLPITRAETLDPVTMPAVLVPVHHDTVQPRVVDQRALISQQVPGLRGRAQ